MANVKITGKFLANAPPVPEGKDKVRYFCNHNRGLVAEVRKSGTISLFAMVYLPSGKTRQVKIGRYPEITIDQAVNRLYELRATASNGIDPTEESRKLKNIPKFKDFAIEYLLYVKPLKKTWVTDEMWLRTRLLKVFGEKTLDKIETAEISRFHRELSQEMSNASANRMLALMRYMFNLAISWGEIDKNPCNSIKPFKENKRERFLQPDEIKKLIEALNQEENKQASTFIYLLLVTGARRSEGLKAKWQDFDLEKKLWKIPIENSKSGKVRYIPLSESAIRAIKGLKPKRGNPYVFTGKDKGHMWSPKRVWDRVKKKAGLDDLRLHDLRHSFASILVSGGRSLYEVQKILGHSKPEMTQRYAHFAPDRLIEATKVVDDALEGQYIEMASQA